MGQSPLAPVVATQVAGLTRTFGIRAPRKIVSARGVAPSLPATTGRSLRFLVEAALSCLALLVGVSTVPTGAAATGTPARSRPAALNGPIGSRSALVASAPVGNGPGAVALNPATQTIYVANGYNTNGPDAGGNTVSVIDARHCNAQAVSRCRGPWPTIKVGNLPSGIAIDERTDTVYVSSGEHEGPGIVSVLDGATCNATNTAGCDQTPAKVPVGLGPLGIFSDDANHTVYVPNYDNGAANSTTVSMIDSATCDASDLSGCPHAQPPTVNVGAAPDAVDVNQATHTVYVTTIGKLNGWTVFDANTCNATDQSGCRDVGHLPGDPAGPNDAEVDTANDTFYTANYDNTVSVFDLADCDASDLSGCKHNTPGTVTPVPLVGFEHDLWLAVDAPLHSVYVAYQKDDSLMVVDTDKCNGTHLAACAMLSTPEIHTGADPESVVVDDQTQTLYTANEVDNDVSVIDARLCNAQTTTGCRHRAPEVAISAAGALTADPGVGTAYVPTRDGTVAMINTSKCNALQTDGCTKAPPTLTVGEQPSAVAVDTLTHTVYVANYGTGSAGTVSAFDDRTCNTTDQAGCATMSTLKVPGGNPYDIAVNSATNTIYVATITHSGPDLISMFNGATCDSTDTGGCGQTPATVAVGSSGHAPNNSFLELAINPATNTIYAANVFNTAPSEPPPYLGNSVYVVNGATCDAADRAGCGQAPAAVKLAPHPPVGSDPFGIAVDEATDTVYTSNIADDEHPGTIAVINGATCNGSDHAGCGQTPATAPVGFGANQVTVDQLTNRVYATSVSDTSVTVINGNTCNGTNHTGCGNSQTEATVGDYPGWISVDPAVGTAYVTNSEGVSIIPLNH